MEVQLGELLGGEAGGVEDADGLVAVEDGDGQGASPAGVGASLGEPSGTGYHEGRLAGAEDHLYRAAVGYGERAGGRSRDTAGARDDVQGIGGAHEAYPVRLEFVAYLLGDFLRWGPWVQAFRDGGLEE